MPKAVKRISDINRRLRRGQAVVMTAMEFKRQVRQGLRLGVDDVDVVTTGTRAVMSGTSAMLSVPTVEGREAPQVTALHINGVPCQPMPGADAVTGLVEAVIYGTAESRDNHGRYGGGHVLRELVEGRAVEVEYRTGEGVRRRFDLTLDRVGFARIYSFRNSYQNYSAFTNVKDHPSYRRNPTSIFACRPIPRLGGLSMSGSGELNPLENDPRGQVIRPGMRILVNGVPGLIVGYGTRSGPAKRCLSLAADMHGMDPQFMGGFKTSYGVEVTNGLAVPFPICDQQVLDDLAGCLDEHIPLPVADLGDRIPLGELRYSAIWRDARLKVAFDPQRCIRCAFQCPAEYYCPMGAIDWQAKTIDQDLCVACGACTANCLGGAFMGEGDAPRGCLGTVDLFDRQVPVIFRQSNRLRSERLAEQLKTLLEAGKFFLADTDLVCRNWHA
jgi:putative methanogenesis marker 16 metalloprotein